MEILEFGHQALTMIWTRGFNTNRTDMWGQLFLALLAMLRSQTGQILEKSSLQ